MRAPRGKAAFVPLAVLLSLGAALPSGKPDAGRDGAFLTTPGSAAGSQDGTATGVREILRTPSGTAIRVVCRDLIPGEAVLFLLAEEGAAARAVVSFLGNSYVLRPDLPLALAGIDIDVKPGACPLDVTVEKKGGGFEGTRRELAVGGRSFPVRRLTVKPEFVTPPTKEIAERIRREAEIVSWIYDQMSPEQPGGANFEAPLPDEPAGNFGQRRVYNGIPRSIHTGLDISAAMGDPVRAANAGRVALASDLYLSGKTVILDHGLGVFTTYGHLSEFEVKRGDQAGRGDIIGRVGSTGRSTGPHLHWGVRIRDSRVDPESLLFVSDMLKPSRSFPKNAETSGAAPRPMSR